MHDPANGLRTIPILRGSVNKPISAAFGTPLLTARSTNNPSLGDASSLPNYVSAPLSVKGVLLMLRRVVLLLGGMMLVGVIVLGGDALAQDIRGTFGQDDLEGTNQLDRIYGLGAADTITGLGGNDDCYGGSGADEIDCGFGMDRIDGGFGFDELLGGPNNDTISAADGFEDNVDCGTGTNDTAYVDNQDTVENCENVWEAQAQ